MPFYLLLAASAALVFGVQRPRVARTTKYQPVRLRKMEQRFHDRCVVGYMRRSFDGLALAAHEHMGEDPQSGTLFVFCNKRRDRLKVLWFDHNGYCLLCKRLHHARFVLPENKRIDAQMLALLLRGVDSVRRPSIRS